MCVGEEETPDPEPLYQASEPLSKERLEAFSDGVYAIVATLLILDIWWVLLSLVRSRQGPRNSEKIHVIIVYY